VHGPHLGWRVGEVDPHRQRPCPHLPRQQVPTSAAWSGRSPPGADPARPKRTTLEARRPITSDCNTASHCRFQHALPALHHTASANSPPRALRTRSAAPRHCPTTGPQRPTIGANRSRHQHGDDSPHPSEWPETASANRGSGSPGHRPSARHRADRDAVAAVSSVRRSASAVARDFVCTKKAAVRPSGAIRGNTVRPAGHLRYPDVMGACRCDGVARCSPMAAVFHLLR